MCKMKKLPFQSIQNFSFIIIVLFFVLSLLAPIFGLFGLVCMVVPVGLAIAGYGKAHCSHICPWGSFFGRILSYVSMKRKALPHFMRTKPFKTVLPVWMAGMFMISIVTTVDDLTLLGSAIFRMMFISFIVGALYGNILSAKIMVSHLPHGIRCRLD